MIDNKDRKAYPCPVCHSIESSLLYRIKGFRIVQCSSCSLAYVNPRIPDENLYDMYAHHYFSNVANGYENYELNEHLRMKTFRRWYTEVEPYLKQKSGTALDIGCAAGYFLKILHEHGWNVEGIELEKEMNALVQKNGYRVYDSPLEYFPEQKKYQLISLFDVIEHLPKLSNHIEKLSNILAENGSIILVTPDFNSTQRKFFRKRWFQFKPYEHIQYFTFSSLEKVFSQHNLCIVHHQHSGQFADTSFLYSRLKRYNFKLFANIFKMFVKVFHLHELSWYADTGSMLVVLQKKG